jgi:hypothetical protein
MVTDAEFQELKAQVEQITRYFDQSPIEDDSVQQSWPRLDRGLSDVQDMMRFQHMYGIFDRGGFPFWLRDFDNAEQTAVLTVSTTQGVAQSTINGCFHTLKQDLTVSLPMVSAPETQWVVDEYDPIRAADGGDPIVSKVVRGDLDYSQGKNYIVHWEIPRQPNQLLTDAPKIAHRPRVVQHLTVAGASNLPRLPNPGILWGARAYVHGTFDEYMAIGRDGDTQSGPSRWVSTSGPEWVLSTSKSFPRANHGLPPAWRGKGDVVELRGRVRRSNGGQFFAGNDYTIIPNCPDSEGGILMNGGCDQNGNPVTINAAITVGSSPKPVFSPKSNTSWIDLTGLYYYRSRES